MKRSKHGNPILIDEKGSTVLLEANSFTEEQIQRLIFTYPECLPISDIDESYNPLIPVCMELWTSAGPLDILMTTPNGDIAIIETKLWQNPEARRKVIAQILDYAKEISKWNYSDLQREINKKTGLKGNSLYQIASSSDEHYNLNEIDFVDAVSRNLRLGNFLLLIAGDGIREGAIEITEFINQYGNLNFTLALIELSLFKTEDNGTIVFPRTTVKTVEIQKVNIELAEGLTLINDNISSGITQVNDNVSKEIQERRDYFKSLWEEFIDHLNLDDPAQPLPQPTQTWNLYVYPGPDKNSWISAYYAQSKNTVGVYFRFSSKPAGQLLKEKLEEFYDEIKKEIGKESLWSWDQNKHDAFGVRLIINGNLHSKKNRKKIFDFFAYWINKYVNIVRPRIKLIE